MALREPSFTFGIEEEYLLVDTTTRQLATAPQSLLTELEAALPDQISVELMRSQIEVGTRPTTSFADARADLANLRRTVVNLAADHGLAPIAASSHPIGGYRSQETTQNERYAALAADLAGVGRRLVVCGMHVHVGIDDDELRIDLLNQAKYFLPHLLTLSTSSPFWEGEDTGLKSFRLAIFKGLPRTGLPGHLSGWHDYRQIADVLTRSGVIDGPSKIWWDLRPSDKFPTLEMRLTDVCTRLDDAMTVAAFFVCICRMLYRLRCNNQSWREYPVVLLDENRWRAQRYGVSGSLFDYGRGILVPFAELAEELVVCTAEDSAALGCQNDIANVRKIVAEGTSADHQLAVYNDTLSSDPVQSAALCAVVDSLIAATPPSGQ